MPLKLVPPRKGKTPYWSVRGTYLGQYVDRSTKTGKRSIAGKILKRWEQDIERGEFAVRGEPDFASAAISYMKAGGERRFLTPLINHFGQTPLRKIRQLDIELAADTLYPNASPATQNRQVYSPVSAILKHAGPEYDFKLRRPKGSRGRVVTRWLWPEQAEAIFASAATLDAEFEILLRFLCYTGCRISEALKLTCNEIRLAEAFAYVRTSKNGEPRAVFLPPHLVAALANHPRGLERGDQRVFRFHRGGGLRNHLSAACAMASGLAKPKREKRGGQPIKTSHGLDWVNFHTFCHTYATWMRRYAGRDTKGLVGTGRWKSEQSASRYAHVVPSEDARAAGLLPAKRKID
ncbi:MAG: tyrosine-type recombinase/integrase [Pseudolabrys sp.]